MKAGILAITIAVWITSTAPIFAGAVVTKDGRIAIGPTTRNGQSLHLKLKCGELRYELSKIRWFSIRSDIDDRLKAGRLADAEGQKEVARILFGAAVKHEATNREQARAELKNLGGDETPVKKPKDDDEICDPATLGLTDSDNPFDALSQNLQVLSGDALVRFDAKDLAKAKIVVIYYSATWSSTSGKFDRVLVKEYGELKRKHGDQFELVFVNYDLSEDVMRAQMKRSAMPWPVLEHGKGRDIPVVTEHVPDAMPHLVVLDAKGDVLPRGRGQYKAIEALKGALAK